MRLSFSPSIRGHRVSLLLKNGVRLTGQVVEVDPVQVIVKTADDARSVVVVSRDDVTAYSGDDGRDRHPVKPVLHVHRCCNPLLRCNGVKAISVSSEWRPKCELHNEHCELMSGDFFNLSAPTQVRLLDGVQVGDFPRQTKDKGENRARDGQRLHSKVRGAQEKGRDKTRGTPQVGG